jgi:UDP-N-acetylglucosamine 2-epimerase (non-hydrolysing)
LRVVLVAGARPNFMKVAPLVAAFEKAGGCETCLVHTGQHYDAELSRVFFEELGIPRPDIDLEVGSGSHAHQTAEVMIRFEPVLLDRRPDLVVVVGDVNSTLACAVTAAKLGVPVAHVEAGLRSFDESMPEELNRRLTDVISRWLFVSEPSGMENLAREGIPAERCHFVGNVMIDTLLGHRDAARDQRAPENFGVADRDYVVLTLHRPSNVDRRDVLAGILDALEEIAASVPVLLPLHPRTAAALSRFDLRNRADGISGLALLPPLGYLDFLGLMADAMAVLTDSGGIQEETTVLGVPCLTLRENTERPITLEKGTNRLTGSDPKRILDAFRALRRPGDRAVQVPDLWDGQAAGRIVEILRSQEV